MASLKPVHKMKIIRQLRLMEKALKEECYDCMGGQKRLDCKLEECPLYPFRPWTKKDNRTDFKKDSEFISLAKTSKKDLKDDKAHSSP